MIPSRKSNTTKFIQRATIVHGNRYDYSLVDYVDSVTKVKIICPDHGEFIQAPVEHIRGKNCPRCAMRDRNVSKGCNTETFIRRAKVVHGNRYDYSMVNYKLATQYVKIICPEHGVFEQVPHSHLKGAGCPICANNFMDLDLFIKKSRLIHGDRYDYYRVVYTRNSTKVAIICPVHGEFRQRPNAHLRGSGCSLCGLSHGEERIGRMLDDIGIVFERQKWFKTCVYRKTLYYDFFLPSMGLLIEYHGKQHFGPVDRFGGYYGFKLTQERDSIKREWAASHGYGLLEFTYMDTFDEIKGVLTSLISIAC